MLPERITKRIEVDANGCWLWLGTVQPNGYSYTKWRRADGIWANVRVHRLAYEDRNGPIPTGMEIDHLCKVRHCINPDHLRAVTHQENLVGRLPRRPAIRSHCIRGHAFDEANTRLTPTGAQQCRTCARDWVRYYRSLKK